MRRARRTKVPDATIVEVLLRGRAGHDPHDIAESLGLTPTYVNHIIGRRARTNVRLNERFTSEELEAEIALRKAG